MAGRPPIPEDQRKGAPPLRIRLSAEEKRMLDEAAKKAFQGRTVPGSGVTSTWARDLLLREAERLLKKE